jgi:hypothetical protein
MDQWIRQNTIGIMIQGALGGTWIWECITWRLVGFDPCTHLDGELLFQSCICLGNYMDSGKRVKLDVLSFSTSG